MTPDDKKDERDKEKRDEEIKKEQEEEKKPVFPPLEKQGPAVDPIDPSLKGG